ncbi:MAG: Arm DNA-binding domain-containing protein [Acidiferrobacterales bacterium]|nr:Arm DNA-binding domain-containing protein [Acidiferrobacterales bacterium]
MLTKDLQIKNLKSADKPYKKSVGNGLSILVQPNGAKYWRYSYRVGKTQKTLALGVYPNVRLKQAKEKRDEAQRLLTKVWTQVLKEKRQSSPNLSAPQIHSKLSPANGMKLDPLLGLGFIQ